MEEFFLHFDTFIPIVYTLVGVAQVLLQKGRLRFWVLYSIVDKRFQ